MKRISFTISLIILVLGTAGFAQNEIIDELLNRPLKTTFIDGDTFLQRDLTDYLNATLGITTDTFDDTESDSNRDVAILKDYFMRPHPSVATITKYFKQASNEFGVPVTILMIIGQIENNWTQTGPTIDHGWGIMHLVQNGYCNTLGEAAELIGVSEQVLKDNALQNIRGAAALISKYAGGEKENFSKAEDWFETIAKFSGLISPELREMQAINYLETLENGVRSKTVWGEEIVIESKKKGVGKYYLNNLDRLPYKKLQSPDYGPALTNLTPCNYTTGRNHSIDTWVNHWIGTGTYLGAISRFHDCTQEVSAHFVIKNNGEITQVVLIQNTAWHCGVVGQPYNNTRSIGVEHEATAANPGLWNSTAMLDASAKMARYFKNQIGFPTTQNSSPGICGHNDMPGTATQCPGPLPWTTWMAYFNATITPPSNDNCSNATSLISNTSCNYTSGTVLNATASGLSQPSCDGFSSTPNLFDVWYKFTASTSSHTITVAPSGSGGDPVVSVYSSCSGSQIGCSDIGNVGVTETLVLSGLITSNIYYVRVYDYGGSEPVGINADFQICVIHATGTPTITLSTPSLPDFGNVVVGQSSTSKSYTVSASDLTTNLTIEPTGGFEISLNQNSGFTNLLTFTPSGGTVTTKTIYVRFSPTGTGTYTGNIMHTSTGATQKNVSVSGTGGAEQYGFVFNDFSNVENISFMLDALHSESKILLTPSDFRKRGAMWFNSKQKISEGFETIFSFTITDRTQWGNSLGAEGFAFVIQNNGLNSIGGDVSAIGYGNVDNMDGIPNSIAIEFDTYKNDDMGDPDSNHLSVNTRGLEPNNQNHLYSLGSLSLAQDISDGQTHTVKIQYLNRNLKIFLDNLATPIYSMPIIIEDTLNLDNGKGWIGFTAATGWAYEKHNILSWLFTNITDISEEDIIVPKAHTLEQNFPNPFNPTTRISYSIPNTSYIELKVFDVFGIEVRTLIGEVQSAGNYNIDFDASNLASGVYYYRLQAGDYFETKKMILMK